MGHVQGKATTLLNERFYYCGGAAGFRAELRLIGGDVVFQRFSDRGSVVRARWARCGQEILETAQAGEPRGVGLEWGAGRSRLTPPQA